ncbi:MAG: Abi family protein, partial [Muribaculaceae bacterium]|nr:Abi family protein [Muribaculaceae bacterium]
MVSLLKKRGLVIDDVEMAEHYLTMVGYYRLSAYMHPFLAFPKTEHRYKPDSSFKKVMAIYRFDKELRLFIFNEIEKIEIAVRSALVNVGSEMNGDPFWMTNPNLFKDRVKFNKTLELIDVEIKRSNEDFINHFYKVYSNPYPPAWMLAEVLPFGVITNIYSNIKDNKIKKNISKIFDLQVAPFQSWLTIVTLTRNNCCHHSRLWNKRFTLLH